MASPLRWPDALLAGLASSMRTFSTPLLLALRGRISGRPRTGVLLLAAGEIAMDKSPLVVARTALPALAGRVGAGAASGAAIAGPSGVAAGAAGAAIGTYASFRTRKLVVDATGLPDPVVAVGEDILALTTAAIATRPDDRPPPASPDAASAPPPRRSPLRDAATGVAAGLAGTAAMTITQGAQYALTGAQPSSAPAEVTDRLKRAAGRGRLKRSQRPAANQGAHWLYGTSWGIPYGIVAGSTNAPPELTGPAFGLLVWGVGLAQQPALGVAEVPWRRSLASLGSEALLHLVYGVGAGAAWRALRRASR